MPTSAPGPEGRVRSPSTYQRAKSLYEAYSLAVGLAPSAVAEKTGYALGEILKGLLPGFVEMLVVLGATTAIGGALGGVIGFFFGGVGAAPGVVIGGEIGLDVGVAAITWLGLGFLVVAIAQGFGELWSTLSRGVERAWAAPEYAPRQYPYEIARAAKEMADSVGILMLIILQGLVAWILKRAAVKSTASAISTANRAGALGGRAAADEALGEALAELRNSRLGGEFANWVERNWKTLRDDPRLKVKLKAGTGSKGRPTEDLVESSRESQPRSTKSGSPSELMAIRQKVAEDFYRSKGFSDAQIANHLKGIDLTKPVNVITLKPGTELVQFQAPGGPTGKYYGLSGATPSSLGIAEQTLDRATGQIADKVPKNLVVSRPVDVLQTTAAPIEDTWSIPGKRIKSAGGAVQYFTTETFTK